MSRTLIPDSRFEDIPIRVMNVHSEPITMRKGTDVATLQPLEILGRQVGVRGEADRNTPVVSQQFIGELVGGVDGSVPLQTQRQLGRHPFVI